MLPRLIALCGNPKSGKSTAQRILQEKHGYIPADDGRPLREIVSSYLGATWEQVSTQAGKAEFITINGKRWQVRDALGQMGNVIEQVFGGDAICEMGLRANGLGALIDAGVMPLAPLKVEGQAYSGEPRYSFGSVRREQGLFYRNHGGIVVELEREEAPPSEFEFDQYNRSAVQYTIVNDDDIDQLTSSIATLLRWVETGDPRVGYDWMETGRSQYDGRFYELNNCVMKWS